MQPKIPVPVVISLWYIYANVDIGLDKSGYQVNSFLISQQKHMLWYSLEAPHRGASNEYPQHMFLLCNKKNIDTSMLKKAPYQELCIEHPSLYQLTMRDEVHTLITCQWSSTRRRQGMSPKPKI